LPRFRRQTRKVKLSSGAATECRILSVIGPTNTPTGLLDGLSAHRFDGHTPINDVNRSGDAGQGVQRACPHEIVPERRVRAGTARPRSKLDVLQCEADDFLRETTGCFDDGAIEEGDLICPPIVSFLNRFIMPLSIDGPRSARPPSVYLACALDRSRRSIARRSGAPDSWWARAP
jgi:hypothetical protein